MRKSSDKVVDKLSLPAPPADPTQAMASTATALMATLVATHSSQASAGAAAAPPRPVRQESRPLLALRDAPREHPAPEEISVEQEKTMAEDFAAPVDASQLPDHLDKLRVSLGRPSAGGNLKRPAAAEPAAEEELPVLPRRYCRVAMQRSPDRQPLRAWACKFRFPFFDPKP